MNRSVSLHPLSLISGIVLTAICFLSMSQVWPAGQHVVVGYGPDPRDYVQVRGTTPYTVPAGKIFVLRSVGTQGDQVFLPSQCQCAVHLTVNGANEYFGYAGGMQSVVDGVTIPAGSTIALISDFGGQTCCPNYDSAMRAWGYLAPQ